MRCSISQYGEVHRSHQRLVAKCAPNSCCCPPTSALLWCALWPESQPISPYGLCVWWSGGVKRLSEVCLGVPPNSGTNKCKPSSLTTTLTNQKRAPNTKHIHKQMTKQGIVIIIINHHVWGGGGGGRDTLEKTTTTTIRRASYSSNDMCDVMAGAHMTTYVVLQVKNAANYIQLNSNAARAVSSAQPSCACWITKPSGSIDKRELWAAAAAAWRASAKRQMGG